MDGAYEQASPFLDRVAQVNRLYEQGHQVILMTARGSTTGIEWRPLTEIQLRTWGVKYHALHFGKPTADLYIDDKAVRDTDWFEENS